MARFWSRVSSKGKPAASSANGPSGHRLYEGAPDALGGPCGEDVAHIEGREGDDVVEGFVAAVRIVPEQPKNRHQQSLTRIGLLDDGGHLTTGRPYPVVSLDDSWIACVHPGLEFLSAVRTVVRIDASQAQPATVAAG